MNVPRRFPDRSPLLTVLCLLLPASASSALDITGLTVGSGQVEIRFDSSSDAYYILKRGSTVTDIHENAALQIGLGGANAFTDADTRDFANLFYLIQEVPLNAPIDTDGDGIDDLFELLYPDALDPLDGVDAQLDFDNDGRTNFQEYEDGTIPTDPSDGIARVTVEEVSPLPGENDIAITRETVFRLSGPLADGSSINETTLFAEFGGERLAGRIHLSRNRETVTLFYPDGLPPSARVRATFIGDGLTGTDGLEIDPDGDGMPGGRVTVDFETVTLTTLETTSVSGRIFVSEPASGDDGEPTNAPLEGVTISVDGMEETLFATTDDMGNFRLQPAPTGRFFVHIDGKTATMDIPEGAYFPTVGKAWTSVAGQETSVGEIYLPMIPPDTLREASMTDDTILNFSEEFLAANPQFRGVEVMIPADSLFANDGTRGGMVGIAPVPPDRLPGALPEGLAIQDVVTIQTDGASNFDTPAPICLPNLPDPETGELLPPGAKSALWSFNHDSGRFEIVGSMTVNEDGTLVCSDPGVGILAPGWHGSLPGTSGRARVPRIVAAPPPPPNCPPNTNVDYANALYKAGRGAWPCVKDFIPIGDSVKCGLEIFTLVPDLLVKVQELKAIAEKNPKEAATALNLLFQTMKFSKDRIVNLHSCFDAIGKTLPTPDKLATFSTCLKAVTGPLEQLCAIYANPTWPKECLNPTTDQACRALEGFNALHAEADQLIGLTRKLQDEFVITVVCQIFNKIETLIKIVTATPTGQGAQVLSQDESIEELRAEIDALGVELEKLLEFGDTLDRLNGLSEGYLNQAQTLSDLSGQVLPTVAGPVARPVFYVIDIDGRAARGQTSSQGTLNRNLTPDSIFFFAEYDPVSNTYGETGGRTRGNGEITDLGSILLEPALLFPDSDGDGLVDPAEFVIGTDPDDPDSDDDGVNDLAEVQQGTNPLDGKVANTGIVATVATRGPALDIDALDDVAAVATGASGLAVFNVFNGMNPIAVAQVNTPGSAEAVACDGRFVAVADGSAGLAIVDITDPPAARIAQQTVLGGEVRAVEAAAGLAFAGTNRGLLAKVDMASGAVIASYTLGGVIQDIRIDGDQIFVLTTDRLHIVPIDGPLLEPIGSTEAPGSIPRGTNRRRLFVGGGIAYAVHSGGFVTIDVSDFSAPTLVAEPPFTQSGWKHVTLNGSGLGVAAMSVIPGLRTSSNVFVYDVSNPASPDVFLEQYETPGAARSVAVFNGVAYVADHDAGLQVVNYLEADRDGVAPALTLTTNATNGRSEEGQIFRASVDASDDVQVRNVEFYIDGGKVSTDGSFPFDLRLITPLLSEQSAFTLRARVADTGGNATWSDEVTIEISPDATAPMVVGISPGSGARVGGLEAIAVTFSEPMAEETLDTGSLALTGAGADEEFGTGDDFPVTAGTPGLRGEGRLLVRTLDGDLDYGKYRVTLAASLTDLAGNPLDAPFESTFEVHELQVIAAAGSPADPFQASANAGQRFTITHPAIGIGSVVGFPVVSSGGTGSLVEVAVENVAPTGGAAEVVIPLNAETGDVILPDDSTLFLQIVPTLTAIEGGGRGQTVTIRGTGFIEGAISVRFGSASVVDGGPFTTDGINVYDSGFLNDGLQTRVPSNGDLPYEVITAGGSSGRASDVSMVIAASTTGTPTDADEASANIGQTVNLEGGGFVEGLTMITLETVDSGGTPAIETFAPDTVAADGTSLTFTVPPGAVTSVASVLGGGSGELLQIVPTVTGIDGGRGRFTTILGTGFVEGGVTVRAGGIDVVDQGPFTNDGINVYDGDIRNAAMQLTLPDEARLPYQVITEGGSSGRATDVASIDATSATGTPADAELPSANVGQQITMTGRDFVDGVTRITLDATDPNGTPYVTTIEPDSVSPGGGSLAFTVPPEARTGGASVLNGGAGVPLQIVPGVTAIIGGQGRFSTIQGTGFTEGFTTFVGGPAEVVDGGPFTNDGINVYAGSTANDTLQLIVPLEAELPYRIVTEGGSSGRESDVVSVDAVSTTGTPASAAEASANVDQQVTVLGADFQEGVTHVTLEAIDGNGTTFVTTFDPDTVSPDGRSLSFTVPPEARTGIATVLDGGIGFPLQIVPRVTGIEGGRGRFSTIRGTGFTEGFITFHGGDAQIVDGGPFSNDGINVYGSVTVNDAMQFTVPIDADLPYQIVTEGGSSGRAGDIVSVNASSDTGTPSDPAEASANVGQQVTLSGGGFAEDITMITLEAMDSNGTPFITTFAPDSIPPDGDSLTFVVPPEARTGIATVLDGGAGLRLQIVPRVTAIDGGRGRFSTISGSGFIEGFVTFVGSDAQVVDGGPFSNDGINVYGSVTVNDAMQFTVPANATLPYQIVTEGGSSGRASDVSGVIAVAPIGTPADAGAASANAGQTITLQGIGYDTTTQVAFESMNRDGTPIILGIEPASIAPDGTSLTVVVPASARTGFVTLTDGGSGRWLQIVPTLDTVSTANPGAFARLIGSGFIEGFVTVGFGGARVVDGGPFTNDGANVYNSATANDGLEVTVPAGGSAPASISTEGGTSNSVSP